ncbi:MAG: FAD-binding oxidoreductase [Candidatus Bathyarchaeota archaeon]|nr:FAD-binding oxidoreductase [Candidatus Bathyarchaeota archaeon]MDH5734243.1 FAD-binding oxidoreductase [Candidatus Bathyarchaeota archaeon]
MNTTLPVKLREIVGSKYVSDDLFVRWSYSMDSNIFDIINPTPPLIVVRPGTSEEISRILRLANETRTPVYARGGGTDGGGSRGEKISSSILIDVTRMNKVLEVDEMSQTVTVQAGTTWGKLNKEVEEKGWKLGFKGPYSGYGSTVGGSIAVQSNGYGSPRYGVVAEDMTNLKVVLPNGEILETGSAVNPKAKKFYRYCIGPDLAGIFVGSGGCFGVIAEVTLRLYPRAIDSAFGAYGFRDYESCQKCYYRWLKTREAEHIAWFAKDGLDVNTPELAGEGYISLLTFVVEDQTHELVEARAKLLNEIAREEGGESLDAEKYAKDDWNYKFELLPRWAAKIGQWQWNCHMIPAGDTLKDLKTIMAFLDQHKEELKKHNITHSTVSIAHKNAGHVSTSLYYDQSNPEAVDLVKELSDKYAEITTTKSGGCNYWLGKFWYPYTIMRSPIYRKLLIKIKKAIDPNNIMNPGGLTLPCTLEEE